MIVALVIICAMSAALLALAKRSRGSAEQARVGEETWDAALANADDTVSKVFISAGRKLEPVVVVDRSSSVYRTISAKLAGTGKGFYANSVEVFVSAQVAAILIASILIAVASVIPMDTVMRVVVVILALGLASYPYQNVVDVAKKRAAKVRSELPSFAELLLMPISSGMGLLPALSFTAKESQGLVADEVRTLLGLLAARSGDVGTLFTKAGQNLGDPSAVAFFSAIHQSYEEGVALSKTIRAQAEQLRHQQHQEKRAALKKIPNTMVLIIALHLLPFVMIVVGLPTLNAMGSM